MKHILKKAVLPLVISLLIQRPLYAQTSQEAAALIAEYITNSIQIPVAAQTKLLNEVVKVRVIKQSPSSPPYVQVLKGFSKICDKEALRVVKSVNPRLLSIAMAGNPIISFEVKFENTKVIHYENGSLIEYFDKDKKPTDDPANAKFLRSYAADSVTGYPTADIKYFKIKNKENTEIASFSFKIDSTSKHYPGFSEKAKDSIKIVRFSDKAEKEGFDTFYASFYANKRPVSRKVGDLQWEYYPNGTIDRLMDENKILRVEDKWYANGLKAYSNAFVFSTFGNEEKMISAWDSLGRQTLIEGNGSYERYYLENNKILTESGLVKNSKRDGKIIAKFDDGNIDFEEEYKEGKCLGGIKYNNDGTKTTYKEREENAEFIGGYQALGQFLSQNLVYPQSAVKSNKQGKVFISFVVCQDGSLCDYEVIRSIDPQLDAEALRVVKLQSGKWKPGKQFGKPVKSKFNLPISFLLE